MKQSNYLSTHRTAYYHALGIGENRGQRKTNIWHSTIKSILQQQHLKNGFCARVHAHAHENTDIDKDRSIKYTCRHFTNEKKTVIDACRGN